MESTEDLLPGPNLLVFVTNPVYKYGSRVVIPSSVVPSPSPFRVWSRRSNGTRIRRREESRERSYGLE